MAHLLNAKRIRERRDERDLSNKELAGALGISELYLRNVLSGSDKPGSRLVHRIGRVLGLTYEEVTAATTNDGVPDGPPKQPTGPKGPVKRQDTEQERKGPKRAADQAVA